MILCPGHHQILIEVDHLAAAVEFQRLQDMGVIEPLSEGDAGLSLLTTRMLYDWRIKEWKNPLNNEVKRRWMRRGRLVENMQTNDVMMSTRQLQGDKSCDFFFPSTS